VTAAPRRIEAGLPDGREVSLFHQQRAANWGLDQALLNRTDLTMRDRQVQLLVGRARSELTESLRPLRELSDAVARRDPQSTEPFPIGSAREVEPIAQRLNELLLHIADQRQRERRFLADTAHELRNPLAGAREVYWQRSGDVHLHVTADPELLRA
jgi:signal transduction histidine kinase